MPPTPASFPADFVWGVATSSYQIEGATREDGRGPSIWDTFCATPGKVAGGGNGDIACDHYHRWENDLEFIRSLGARAYRFSVAWPRILPAGTGPVNPKGLDFYDRLVDGMLARDLEPYCTLYHWDLPQALEDRGGWTHRGVVDAFVSYADAVTRRLGDRVKAYATLNEPWCSAHLGYASGEHAPGRRNLAESLQAAHHLLLAHGSALDVMRTNAPHAKQGIVLNLAQTYAATGRPEDAAAAARFDRLYNGWYLGPLLEGRYPEDIWEGYGDKAPEVEDGDLERIRAPLDYLGVNYYTRSVIRHRADGDWPHLDGAPQLDAETTDMGWEVYPQGLADLLVRLTREHGLPLFVTENGAAYPDRLEGGAVHDDARVHYLRRHIVAVQDALARGADVRGYFAWSLLDNFEWAYGYAKRFGLIYVDYDSQMRTLKDSARWYREFVARQRGEVPA
ncbi:MAG TPA: GH1 family beta-glucosidase [Trueperaceae bacterium]